MYVSYLCSITLNVGENVIQEEQDDTCSSRSFCSVFPCMSWPHDKITDFIILIENIAVEVERKVHG